ncbi:GGDEF domain-containing protein [bacterium]|nr:GGDEF domain-containing protein [bacterium]
MVILILPMMYFTREYLPLIIIFFGVITSRVLIKKVDREFSRELEESQEVKNVLLPEKEKYSNLIMTYSGKRENYDFLLKNYLYFIKESGEKNIFKKLLFLFSKFLKGTGYVLSREKGAWKLFQKFGNFKVDIKKFNFDSGIIRELLLYKKMVIVENIDKDYRYNILPGIKNVKSTIAFPLLINYKVAYIIKWDFTEEAAFDYHLIKLLQTLIFIVSNKLNIDNYLAELKYLGTIDSLTQLYDRTELQHRLYYLTKNQRQFNLSLIMLDIDDFKGVNDTYGHLYGDVVLKELSKIIKQSIRLYDVPFRYGGEEFVILLPDTILEEAKVVGERIRKSVQKTKFMVKEKKIHITITLGISQLDNELYTPKKLINAADKALYEGKAKGKNICVLYQKK